jgi:hypothetical protein
MSRAAALAVLLLLALARESVGFSFGQPRQQAPKTIAGVGANGKTGRKAVAIALQENTPVVAITTSGVFNTEGLDLPASAAKSLQNSAGNVQDLDGLKATLKGCKAAIFAASASKTGGTPQQVDRDGLVNVAKACIANKVDVLRLGLCLATPHTPLHVLVAVPQVPRLVVVSSGAVTKPFSPVYLFLNLFGGIMKAKIEGEREVARLYVPLTTSSLLPYVDGHSMRLPPFCACGLSFPGTRACPRTSKGSCRTRSSAPGG